MSSATSVAGNTIDASARDLSIKWKNPESYFPCLKSGQYSLLLK